MCNGEAESEQGGGIMIGAPTSTDSSNRNTDLGIDTTLVYATGDTAMMTIWPPMALPLPPQPKVNMVSHRLPQSMQ